MKHISALRPAGIEPIGADATSRRITPNHRKGPNCVSSPTSTYDTRGGVDGPPRTPSIEARPPYARGSVQIQTETSPRIAQYPAELCHENSCACDWGFQSQSVERHVASKRLATNGSSPFAAERQFVLAGGPAAYQPAAAALAACYEKLGETEKPADLKRRWGDEEEESGES